jgi:hypothetical protein
MRAFCKRSRADTDLMHDATMRPFVLISQLFLRERCRRVDHIREAPFAIVPCFKARYSRGGSLGFAITAFLTGLYR